MHAILSKTGGKCVSETVSKEKNLVSSFQCKQMSSHSKNSTSGNSLEDVSIFVCVCWGGGGSDSIPPQ